MKKIKKLCKFNVFLIIILVSLYLLTYLVAYLSNKIDIHNINKYYLYDNSNELYAGNSDNWVTIDNISPELINATISIEDKNFYKHIGFDYLRIIKAMMINIKNGKSIQGASTITQQYAKNLFLTFDKTWERKIKEAWITINLETHYKKEDILEGYLNTINYGGIYGIKDASEYYFNKQPNELTLAEASILAGIPKSPSNYSPINNLEKSKSRQKIILYSMVNNNIITKEEMNKAYEQELTFIGKFNDDKSKTIKYYEDAVLQELYSIKDVPNSLIEKGGLKIYTNLDRNLQQKLENNIDKYMDDKEIQISSVISNSNTGQIYALVGGRDYSKSEFNRATSSQRQVGSTLKPFLYYSAIENGFTASTTFNSSKTTFVFSNDQTYSPNNFGNIYGNKEISLAAALAYSDNIYAVKTNLFLGEENLVNMLKRVGITSKLEPVPSLALGTFNINMLEMIKAYSSLASNGYKVEPHLIEKVEDKYGNTLYEYKNKEELILNQSIVYIMNELLSNCYSPNFVDYNYPTCYAISNKLTNKYSLKTGTTDTDSLVFGYNNNIVMGIWAGYDNNKNITSKIGTEIKNIWADTVEGYLKDKKNEWYKMPSNVVGTLVNPISGLPAKEEDKNKTILYYIKGTEPTRDHNELDSLIPTIKED